MAIKYKPCEEGGYISFWREYHHQYKIRIHHVPKDHMFGLVVTDLRTGLQINGNKKSIEWRGRKYSCVRQASICIRDDITRLKREEDIYDAHYATANQYG